MFPRLASERGIQKSSRLLTDSNSVSPAEPKLSTYTECIPETCRICTLEDARRESAADKRGDLKMSSPDIKTNPAELLKFHTRIMKYAPNGYSPFYFVLEIEGKEPREGISWKNNRKTIHEALYWMKKGHNIAICATAKDCLCIVDIDDLEQVPEIKPTLQVTSRKRLVSR